MAYTEHRDSWMYIKERSSALETWMQALLGLPEEHPGSLHEHKVNSWGDALWITASQNTICRRGERMDSQGNKDFGREGSESKLS